MSRLRRVWSSFAPFALAATLLGSGGCLAAAAAGAGAGAGYYFTSRGVGSTVAAPVDEVATRAEAVLTADGVAITVTATEDSGDKRVLKGKKGDLDIEVELSRSGPAQTKAEVSARKNAVEWDKEYAQSIVDRLVRGG
jgi:hypothetical protein